MALTKRTYVNNETVITAENLNDIQDSIIALENGATGGTGGTGGTEDLTNYATKEYVNTSFNSAVSGVLGVCPTRAEVSQMIVEELQSRGLIST